MRPGLYGLDAAPQSMSVPKKRSDFRYARTYGPGTGTWICPASGVYRFVPNGGGGGGSFDGTAGGGSGSHAQKVRRMVKGEAVEVALGTGYGVNAAGPSAVLTFADGATVTAGGGIAGGSGGAGGVASGGDINISGNPSAGSVGGLGVHSGLFAIPSGRGGEGAAYSSPPSLLIVLE